MVEPTRKKNKSRRGPDLRVVRPSPTPRTHEVCFVTRHATHPYKLDLQEFVDGADGPKDQRQIKRWKGNFSGRPSLLRQLLPTIHELYGSASEASCRMLIKALRQYWRIFDRCDAIPGLAPVIELSDLNGIHEAEQFREGINRNISYAFVRLADGARRAIGLPPLYWAITERNPGVVRDMLEREQVRAIYNVLKDRVREIYAVWDDDQSLVPSKRDAQNILYLLLAKTGWNEGTALNIDVDEHRRPHPTDQDRHLLHAVKTRAGGREQHHVGRNKEEWSPGNLNRPGIRGGCLV